MHGQRIALRWQSSVWCNGGNISHTVSFITAQTICHHFDILWTEWSSQSLAVIQGTSLFMHGERLHDENAPFNAIFNQAPSLSTVYWRESDHREKQLLPLQPVGKRTHSPQCILNTNWCTFERTACTCVDGFQWGKMICNLEELGSSSRRNFVIDVCYLFFLRHRLHWNQVCHHVCYCLNKQSKWTRPGRNFSQGDIVLILDKNI